MKAVVVMRPAEDDRDTFAAPTAASGIVARSAAMLRVYRAFFTKPDPPFASFDYATYYERTFRSIARRGVSKIAPFKRFNAQMFEDMNNQGPFGGMLLPFDYNVYYETGKPRDAVLKALSDPLIQEMYGIVFKKYMMDDFMHFMGIDSGWTIPFKGEIQPRWMRQDATLMLNHSITKDAVDCRTCHAEKDKGIMPFEELGYPPARVQDLRQLPELKMVDEAVRRQDGK